MNNFALSAAVKVSNGLGNASRWLRRDKQAKAAQSARTLAVLGAGAVVLLGMAPEMAMAAPWDSTATKLVEVLTGGMARSIAILAVAAAGIAAMSGKLAWDWVIKIVVGIVFIFGGASIVDTIKGAATAA